MTSPYELLVIDLDGTLIGSSGMVSPANRHAVHRAREAGMEIVIATGRALVESGEYLQAIEHEGFVVAAGGALLNDAATGRTLASRIMPENLVVDVTNALLPHGHKVLILKDPDVTGYDYLAVGPAELDPASEWWFEVLPVRVRFVHDIADDPHPHHTVRAGAVAAEEELAPIARRLKSEIGDRGFLQHWAAVTETAPGRSATHVLEVFNPDVNKWTMIDAICRQRGIEPAAVAALGDGLNDVELIRGAGLGIAMGNADPRVLAVADRVTDDATSDGVAVAIDRLLDGRW